jgi:hypothetical protein
MRSVHAADREVGVDFRVGAFSPRAMAKMDLQPESLQRCPMEGIVVGLALHRFIAYFSIKRNTDLDTMQGLLFVTLEEALPTQELGPEAGSTEKAGVRHAAPFAKVRLFGSAFHCQNFPENQILKKTNEGERLDLQSLPGKLGPWRSREGKRTHHCRASVFMSHP